MYAGIGFACLHLGLGLPADPARNFFLSFESGTVLAISGRATAVALLVIMNEDEQHIALTRISGCSEP